MCRLGKAGIKRSRDIGRLCSNFVILAILAARGCETFFTPSLPPISKSSLTLRFGTSCGLRSSNFIGMNTRSHSSRGLASPRCQGAGSRGGALFLSCYAGMDEDSSWWREIPTPEPGSVLIANESQIDHFFKQAVVLVLETGSQGSRGVILEMATAFNMGEMSKAVLGTPFENNALFRGGDGNSDKTIMLHGISSVNGSVPVGHGMYVGGIQSAAHMVHEGLAASNQFKFIFNHCEWAPGALERECAQGLWRVGIVSPDLCLRQISSQSDRPMNAKQKRMTPDEPLWSLARKQMLSSTAERPPPPPQPSFGADSQPGDVVLSPSKKMIIRMVTERIYFWRSRKDAVSLVPILDTGAEVFGKVGNDNIKEVIEKQWEGATLDYIVDTQKDIRIGDDGVVLVDFTLEKLQDGVRTIQKMREEISFSASGMIRSMRVMEEAK